VIKHGPEKGYFFTGLICILYVTYIPCLHFSENFKKFENLGGVKLKHLLEIQNMHGRIQRGRTRAALELCTGNSKFPPPRKEKRRKNRHPGLPNRLEMVGLCGRRWDDAHPSFPVFPMFPMFLPGLGFRV
jgi:hypothetical protein